MLQALASDAASYADAALGTIFLEYATVDQTFMDPSGLETLSGNINSRWANGLLQDAKMVLAKIGEIIGDELRLAGERSATLGVVNIDLVVIVIQHQAKVVPDALGERSLPKCLLWAGGAGAKKEQGLRFPWR